MTYHGPHERTVVQGTDTCTCGNDWPCPSSAEGRWTELRTRLERLHRTTRDESAGTAVKGTPVADWISARADGIWDALELMDELGGKR